MECEKGDNFTKIVSTTLLIGSKDKFYEIFAQQHALLIPYFLTNFLVTKSRLSHRNPMSGIFTTVNFSWLFFASLMIGRNLLTEKMEFKYIVFRRLPFCRLIYALYVWKWKHSYVRKAYNKRNCFLSNSDHYLIGGRLMEVQLYSCFTSHHASHLNLSNN